LEDSVSLPISFVWNLVDVNNISGIKSILLAIYYI